MPNLSKRTVEALTPKGKDYIVWDESLKGFGVKVTPKGKKSYLVKYLGSGNKQRRPALGVHGTITCEQARDKAKEYLSKMQLGIDLMDERNKAKEELTFNALFDEYMKKHSKPHKKSWWRDEEYYDRHIRDEIGREQLSAITHERMVKLHHKIGYDQGSPSMANQIITLIGMIFNKAIEWGYFNAQPPTRFIKKFKTKSRDRFLQKDELPRFFEGVNQEEDENLRDFFKILLFTGQRKGNVLAMNWSNVHFSEGYWYIPDTKNGEPHTIPLIAPAIEILARRFKEKTSEWVFPAESASGHLVDPKKAWKRILKRAEIEDLNMHDLRRTMGSYQTIGGSNSFIVAKSLGHKSIKSTEIYARLNIDPVRESMEQAANLMMGEK